mmetsp:Transcript_18529/g.26048  ORF Transcript_18529/g.26048 Transcript_18529/m.26048 type:complete len:201 (+) Transcript_18529:331-933(+)
MRSDCYSGSNHSRRSTEGLVPNHEVCLLMNSSSSLHGSVVKLRLFLEAWRDFTIEYERKVKAFLQEVKNSGSHSRGEEHLSSSSSSMSKNSKKEKKKKKKDDIQNNNTKMKQQQPGKVKNNKKIKKSAASNGRQGVEGGGGGGSNIKSMMMFRLLKGVNSLEIARKYYIEMMWDCCKMRQYLSCLALSIVDEEDRIIGIA